MNIFLTDRDPEVASKDLDDSRLNKMILETTQILCVAYRYLFPEETLKHHDILYKSSHENHPCSLWVKKNHYNYYWLVKYLYFINKERLRRTNKEHKSYNQLFHILVSAPINVTADDFKAYCSFDCNFTPNCTSQFKDKPIFEAYKYYLAFKWINFKREPKWTNSTIPAWFYQYKLSLIP